MDVQPVEEKPKPFQFSLRTLFIVTAVFAMLLSVAVIVRDSQSPQGGPSCSNNMKMTVLMLLDYETTNQCFPPAYTRDAQGRLMHSWRARIVPDDVGFRPWYNHYNWEEPWDGPGNSKLHMIPMRWYSCPNDPHGSPTMTNYLAVTGPGTAWPGEKTSRVADFKGDRSQSILVVESRNTGIHWMEPRDLEIDKISMTINGKSSPDISSAHAGGTNADFADGHVEFLSNKTDPKVLEALLRIDNDKSLLNDKDP
jgi:prepilin-type processing-associated H-X9-DG protein